MGGRYPAAAAAAGSPGVEGGGPPGYPWGGVMVAPLWGSPGWEVGG